MDAENLPTDGPGPTPVERYRLVVLGGGPAGSCAAREAARRGVRVALVLPAPPRAAEPLKTPLAEQIRQVQTRSGQLGSADPPDEPGVDLYRGQPVLSRRHTVVVEGRELHFHKALIATGAAPAPVEMDGVDQNACLMVDTLTELTELPRRLAVIGTGAAACQWAQAFGRFGSQVHLIGRERTILPDEDPAAAAMVQAQMEQDGVRLHLGCREPLIETMGNLQGVVIEQEGQKGKLLVDKILFCGPWRPNTAGLGLETAAMAYDGRGIVVDDRLRTTDPHIFAAGAVCGAEFASLQAAEATARLAVHNALCITSRKLDRLVIPHCIYTKPAVAQVGLTRGEAADRQIEIDTYRAELSEADPSIPLRRRQGFITVHVRRRTGRLVGATIVAEDADELIAPLVLLMTRRLPLSALAEVIPCRPSRSELLIRLAKRHVQTPRGSPWAGWMQRWRGWLKR